MTHALVRVLARACGVAAALVGVATLVGLALGSGWTALPGPQFVAMAPDAAAAIALGGISLVAQLVDSAKRLGRLVGVGMALTGAAALAAFFAGAPAGMAASTALVAALLGTALALLPVTIRGGHAPAQPLAAVGGLLSLVVVVGYLYGVREFVGMAELTRMAPHTAVALALLSVGILLARHEAGPIMRVLSRDTAGGLLARRALPAAIGAPLLVGLLEVLAYDASLFSARFGGALFAVTMIVFFCVLIWSTALRVDRVDRHRLEAERFALRERELRRTAEELRAEAAERTAQLEIEAGTREELLAIVSHDLRAPLSAIAFAAQSVDMRARRVDDDAASGGLRKSAETILRSCDQMDSLIVSLLDFAAARHGTLAIEPPRPVAAAALLEDARTFLLPSAEKKSVRLEVDASDVLALCDRRRVVQVITNLGVNAIKFTPAGGRVRISAHARRRSVEFEVADTGVGIREEDAARIFDPYWRGTSKARGIGLGLFIARTIVEAHGGRIEVSSRPNEGAVFRFTIPAGQGAPRQPHA